MLIYIYKGFHITKNYQTAKMRSFDHKITNSEEYYMFSSQTKMWEIFFQGNQDENHIS